MFHVKQLTSTLITLTLVLSTCLPLVAQSPNINNSPFKQLYEELPTPNTYRTASGAPGVDYWQQQVDHVIHVTLDETTHRITGTEQITYHNNSPDALPYLWLQLDQNVRAKDSDTYKIGQSRLNDQMTPGALTKLTPDFDGGFKISRVANQDGSPLDYTINKTMMRLDLPTPLQPGASFTFHIDWSYLVNDRMKVGGRSGYEYFPVDDNALYTIAQFFPRLCVYNDVDGWQNKQFLGRGEFTLNFGDYEVHISVPEDYLVAATGTLQNESKVLTASQREQLKKARTSFEQPVIISSEEDAIENEKEKATKMKTWIFKAYNVRDFAFAASRKFIWDAMAVKQSDGSTVMAMSMYPKEGNPLWEQYSTKAVAHTLKWYSHYTFDYPYPVAWSIHADRIGMEYPMICFNFGRPEKDGTYDARTKYGMISVIIHEVGHNYFPMIVNSDERQWTWMDEGLNSFLQYLAEQQWERNYPSRRGPAYKITEYMSGDKAFITPIMTNSEAIKQFGNNAYGKPATALNILRETIMGRPLFDMAFKTYAQRWMFKQPMPADFFRTMEDASGVDLDWFWRGWFYTTDHVDMAIAKVTERSPYPTEGSYENKQVLDDRAQEAQYISNIRNQTEIEKTYDEMDTLLRDFYSTYDDAIESAPAVQLSEQQHEYIDSFPYFYEIQIDKIGGLVMPIILEFTLESGQKVLERIPAEIWQMGDTSVTKVFPMREKVQSIALDPYLETADTDTSNNNYPPIKAEPSRFQLFKQKQQNTAPNPMQKHKKTQS